MPLLSSYVSYRLRAMRTTIGVRPPLSAESSRSRDQRRLADRHSTLVRLIGVVATTDCLTPRSTTTIQFDQTTPSSRNNRKYLDIRQRSHSHSAARLM